jgi:pimeloyl-ACP methyl ester carboxylesterase
MGLRRVVVVLGLLFTLVATGTATAQPGVPGCQDGTFTSGARWLVCVPPGAWNGEALIFAHGYTTVFQPIDFQHLTLPDGTNLPSLVTSMGFVFAATSYRQNGLAVLEGVADVVDLRAKLNDATVLGTAPAKVWLAGVSEGGLVATLAAERYPSLFEGATAACGPIGDFRFQINYLGDFRVLFDYFFPGVIPGSPMDIPASTIAAWEKTIQPQIATLLAANPARAKQLLKVANAPYDPADFKTVIQTTLGVLAYNIYGTNDAKAKLGGVPFDNRLRWYSGSSNDLLLNLRVKRFSAAPAAVAALNAYRPSGDLSIPLVTLHTTADEIVPYVHELLYATKVETTGRGRFVPLPVFRYGHCAFTPNELLFSIGLLRALP